MDKAEVGEEPKLKGRVIVRADLEKKKQTAQRQVSVYFNLIRSYSDCSANPLGAGGMSTALLVLWPFRLPPEGVHDDTAPEGSLLLAEKATYGTRDAPNQEVSRRDFMSHCLLADYEPWRWSSLPILSSWTGTRSCRIAWCTRR